MDVTTGLDFRIFQQAVATRFATMKSAPLFHARVDRDELWRIYLDSFPAGTNPIFRKRTEHDCSCCRHVIKTVGGMVTLDNRGMTTLWGSLDIEEGHPYKIVADALDAYVRSCPIENVFLHHEPFVGRMANSEVIENHTLVFNHFYLTVLPSSAVCEKSQRDTLLGGVRATHDVFVRGLTEITSEAIETVLDLIKQNSLYRGEEHRANVEVFGDLKRLFDRMQEEARMAFAWKHTVLASQAVTRIRNTVIGTLLCDLSSGVDLETAVKSFETKVAPMNYRRPTALVTPKMIATAKDELERLGLLSSLERRYATREDLTVNNVLFVDRATKKHLKGGVFDTLASTKPVSCATLEKIEEVSIEKFLHDILPSAQSIEVLVENRHTPNFMSLIAPVHDDSPLLFKWPNRFSWSYAGDTADSIKERVKRAGGNVVADLRCSLSWSNHDDLDLHMTEPGKYEIYFANKGRLSLNGGVLDVDMNAGGGTTRTPVENICYPDRRHMREGLYYLFVHQYCQRETRDVGFVVEIEFDGATQTFAYNRSLRTGERVGVVTLRYSKQKGFSVDAAHISSESTSKTVWNVQTQQFQPVSMITVSPNHWDGVANGNKHYFFILDGCRHEGKARGFFNEFLRSDLDRHRKVMELVGANVRTDESEQQLSGLGFSSTQRNSLVCRVRGSFNRQIRVII